MVRKAEAGITQYFEPLPKFFTPRSRIRPNPPESAHSYHTCILDAFMAADLLQQLCVNGQVMAGELHDLGSMLQGR